MTTTSMPRCDNYLVSNIQTDSQFIESPSKRFAWASILFGALGWLAAFSLTLERIHVATTPTATLSCDLNIFISCKSVMLTDQAKLLGFPNSLIGLAAFMAPIFLGFAILAGARFKVWFWRVYLVGLTLGFAFVLWLFIQSTFVIHVLCPYCMVAWVAMIPLFWRSVLWAVDQEIIPVPISTVGFFVRAADNTWVFTFFTELLAALAIVLAFWDKWYLLFA